MRNGPIGRVKSQTMLLAIDVGNTNIVLGVFDGARLTRKLAAGDDAGTHGRRSRHSAHAPVRPQRIPLDRIGGIILSSVVPPLTRTMEEMAEQLLRA